MNRYKKSIEELTICDNFMFVKVFSDEEIAKPFLKALLKIDIEHIEVVGESFQQTDPSKKFVRFDVMVKDSADGGVGKVFDLEMQMVNTKDLPLRSRYYQGICDTETLGSSHRYNELKEQYIIFLCPEDIFGQGRPIYQFENREKQDHDLLLGDLTYKIFCNFSKYSAVNDESIRDYLKYFATGEISSDTTRAIQSKVEFYHKDPKTRSDYMTLKDIIEDEREEARAEGREEGRIEEKRQMARAMLQENIPLDIVSKISGLTEFEIESLDLVSTR